MLPINLSNLTTPNIRPKTMALAYTVHCHRGKCWHALIIGEWLELFKSNKRAQTLQHVLVACQTLSRRSRGSWAGRALVSCMGAFGPKGPRLRRSRNVQTAVPRRGYEGSARRFNAGHLPITTTRRAGAPDRRMRRTIFHPGNDRRSYVPSGRTLSLDIPGVETPG